MSSVRRLLDPSFFDEALAEFQFEYTWYVEVGKEADDLGRLIHKFDKNTILMSLQPSSASLSQNVDGNYQTLKYDWYCKADYRVNIGDFFQDESGNFLHVDSVQQYDMWGVRKGSCTMINLSQYKHFKEYLDYLNGEKIV